MKKISIIVPLYNAVNTLGKCIDSLINQTYSNIEILLVNDGSVDDSLSVCQKYAASDSRIVVIDKPNGGVSSARNKGLDVATGDYVMFCDSDDWVDDNWCELYLHHYSDDSLIMGGVYVIGEQEYYPEKVCRETIQACPKKQFAKLSFFNPPFNKIYNYGLITQYQLRFDEEIHNGEDYLFNLQYITKLPPDAKLVLLDTASYHYVWPTGKSLSSSFDKYYSNQVTRLFQKTMIEIDQMSDVDMDSVYADFFYQYQRAILAIFHSDDSLLVKVREANRVMKSNEYQTCISSKDINDSLRFKLIWKRKNSLGIILEKANSKQ